MQIEAAADDEKAGRKPTSPRESSKRLSAARGPGTLPVSADPGHGQDYRNFHAGGGVTYGQIEDSYTSDLVMYLAENQFTVMDELIRAFQKDNTDIGD